jgi:biofilm PGA synthesis protein PgaA
MSLIHNAVQHFLRPLSVSSACALGILFVLLAGSASAGMRERQSEAVELARNGSYDAALEIFAELRAEYPGEQALLHDEVVIRIWAGQLNKALDQAADLQAVDTPAWVSLTLGKAARNTQRFDEAITWYESATWREPRNLDARLGLAMALADADRAADARAALKKTPAAAQNEPPVLLTSAYLFQREGMFIPAVNEYDRVLERYPNNEEAIRGKVYALQALLLPEKAMELAASHKSIFSEDDMVRLQSDSLALELRRAIRTPNQVYPYPKVNLALAHIDERLATAPPGSQLALQLRYDRVVGRTEAYRTLEAIAEYEALLAEGAAPPAYVHYAAARSYLARERAGEAMQALETAEQLAPDDLEIQIEKFYALSDLNRHEEAIALADELVATIEPMKQVEGSRVVKPNETHTRVRIIAGMGRAYADQLADAQSMLDELLVEAPNNTEARYALGNIYRYRGWEDRPLPEYKQAMTMEPDLMPARISYAYAQLGRQEYSEAGAQLTAIKPMHPGAKSVMDLNEEWILYNSWQFLADATWGESTGDTFGSDQYLVNAWLFTKPLKENYRFYFRTFDNYGDFAAGDVTRKRAAVGTEYRKGVWVARGEVNWDRWETGDSGFAGRVDYRINDEWSAAGTVELNSYLTQLQANRSGIKSNLFAGEVTYVRNEKYSAGAILGVQDYDDGNNQFALSANSTLRFYNGFSYKLDGLASASLLTNSETDTAYFSPEMVVQGVVGVDNLWQMYRRYDAALSHKVTVLGGLNNQKDFGTDFIWTLAYQLNWSINESVDVGGGASLGSRTYSGDDEDQLFFNLRINSRF